MRIDADGGPTSPSRLPYAPNGSPTSRKNGTTNGVNGSAQRGGVEDGIGRYSAGALSLPSTFRGHDREEMARILIQGLQDLGYQRSAAALSQESGFDLESPHASAFRLAILSGDWPEAERLLRENQIPVVGERSGERSHSHGRGRASSSGTHSRRPSSTASSFDTSRADMLFLIRQQKYLELLEKRDIAAALVVLRQELHPLHQEQRQLHMLSSLIMCRSPDDLKVQSGWDGAQGESRKHLLSDLSRAISPSVMIPEHRMATLFHQFKDSKIRECIYHNTREVPSLYMDHSCNRSSFPLELHTELDQHSHEVWFCAFSNDGTRLATASKDKSVIIYDTTAFRVKHVLREHRQPVAYVAWSPDDSRLVSCSQDFEARLWDTKSGRCVRILKHHMEPVSTAAWAPDGKSFVTGSLDLQRPLCVWPSESASSNSSPLHTFDNCSRVEGCAIATLRPESPSALLAEDDGSNSSETNNSVRLVAFCTDKTVHVFDYARREKLRHIVLDWAITCISLSKDGHEMLMNLNCGQIWTVGVEDGAVRQKYWGQRQGNFMIRSCFGGATESFIVSGGEDGRIRVWHRYTGRMLEDMEGHRPTCVNSVNWNKANPDMFASVSDDSKVRIWATPHPGLSQAQVLEQNRRSHNMFRAHDPPELPRWSLNTPGEHGLGALLRHQ